MGVAHRRNFETTRTLTKAHPMAGPVVPVKQVKSLEQTAEELGKIKKREGGTPGALKPATITEKDTKTGTSRSITVEPTMAYGPGTGGKRRRR